MFSRLKEKLSAWTKKVSKKIEDEKENSESVGETDNIIVKKENSEKLSKKVEKKEKRELKKAEREKKREQKKQMLSEQINSHKEKRKIKVKEEKKTSSFGKVKISEKNFENYSEELQLLLLENNVAYEVTEKIIEKLRNRIIDKNFDKKTLISEISGNLKEVIEEILIEPFELVEKIKRFKSEKKEPYVILFCGINGSGKTTTIAKVADYLKRNKLSCVLSASDTFRAASIEQIKKHGNSLGVKVISANYGADPTSVSFDAVQYAKKHVLDVVLIDTAGRMHNAKNLMNELEKINRIIKPNLKIFVGESIVGNDSIEQIRSFDEYIGIDSIILTKADVDEKGGTALSVSYMIKKPILFLGIGQEYNKIEIFDKKKFVKELGL
jgi:fused signal recognition particle receptor